MTTAPDETRPVRADERLPLDSLEPYLLAHLPGARPPLTVRQFPGGYSNLTYALTLDNVEYVLRRPPFGNAEKSAHDMEREFRVLDALAPVYPAAPRPVLLCVDPAVIGDVFYVMERRHGLILRGPTPPDALTGDTALTRRVSERVVDQLAALHHVDYAGAGLEDLGRPEGYTRRQIDGWTRRFDAARTDDVPSAATLVAWLQHRMPDQDRSALIHNDLKYDNIIFDPQDLTTVIAVLDWEMATIGDPLMDLGTSLAYWVQSDDPEPLRARAFGPTAAPGSLTRAGVVERYQERTGHRVSDPLFYYVYGLFKLMGIVQQIYVRFVRGHTADARFAHLGQTVTVLHTVARAAIDRDRI